MNNVKNYTTLFMLIIFLPLMILGNDSVSISFTKIDNVSLNDSIKRLKKTAAIGTGFYFVGTAGTYIFIPIMTTGDMPEESRKIFILPTMISGVFNELGVVVACVQTSKANDLCKEDSLCGQKLPWHLYKAGWISAGAGLSIFLISAIVSTKGNTETTATPGIIALSLWGIKDLLWSIACISSIAHIRRFEKSQRESSSFSINPIIDIKGGLGFNINYNF